MGDGTFWHPVGELLPETWEKHYLSWPGLGHQPSDPAVNGIQDLRKLAEKVLVSPTVLVAQSMGGVVAIDLALRHPKSVTHLVLVASSGGLDMDKFGGIDWRREYLAAYPASARWIIKERPDLTRHFSKVSVPTLLIWGDIDPISPVAVGEYLAQQIPLARMHVVRGGSHSVAADQPEIVAAAIMEHLCRYV